MRLKLIPMIDQLAELYALESMGVNDRNELANLLTEETNGMKFVMGMHKGIQAGCLLKSWKQHM